MLYIGSKEVQEIQRKKEETGGTGKRRKSEYGGRVCAKDQKRRAFLQELTGVREGTDPDQTFDID